MVGSSGEEILPARRNYSKSLGVVRKVGDTTSNDLFKPFVRKLVVVNPFINFDRNMVGLHHAINNGAAISIRERRNVLRDLARFIPERTLSL
jgi:hypothetical protein